MIDHPDFAVAALARNRAFCVRALASPGIAPVIDAARAGLRPRHRAHHPAAYVTDPDGHVIEAVCHAAE